MAQSSDAGPRSRVGLGALLRRGWRLRCPACGESNLFRGWFTMQDPCGHCGRRFDRAPGYLLGSIYINYGVTSLLVVVLYFSLYFSQTLTGSQLVVLLGLFALLFPVWFFRYARALWIALDERFDPWPNEQEARELAAEGGSPGG